MRKRPGLANLLAALGLVAGLLCNSIALGATDEERAAARAMAEKGAAAFQKKDYETSIDLFSRAEALIHSPVHLLFLARSHRALGQLVKAREAYIKITRERLEPSAPKVFFDAQEDASSELEAIEPKLASLTIQLEGAEPSQVDLRVDGEAVPAVLVGVPMPVDPGDHEVTAEAAGVDGQSQSVALKEGQQNEVRFVFDLPKPPPRQPKPGMATGSAQPGLDQSPSRALAYVGWTNVGLGVVGLGIGGYMWSEGSTLQDDADRAAAACGKNCPDEQQVPIFDKDQKAADTKTTAAVVGAISGGVLLTGVVLLIVDSASSPSNTALHPVVGLNQLGVAGVF
jgi:hypothetical protein